MALKLRQLVEYSFKVSCFIIVILMISRWIEKYMKDEDLCLVDYRSFRNSSDLVVPDLSVCLTNPFIDKELQKWGVPSEDYVNHLRAYPFNQSLAKINFTNVTVNLENDYMSTFLMNENGSIYSPTEVNIRSTFTGFLFDQFMKCFTVDTKKESMSGVKYVTHQFKMDTFQYYLNNTMAIFHIPNQYLLIDSGRFFPVEQNLRKGFNVSLLITKIEFMRKRNKPRVNCLENCDNWDELVFKKHIRNIGCKAPYHDFYQNVPICSNEEELKAWHKMIFKRQDEKMPCQTMPRIDYDFLSHPVAVDNVIQINTGYPKEAKIITQSRAVDSDALIGNIGGYIGLFLGYAIIQLPELLLFLHSCLIRLRCFASLERSNSTNSEGKIFRGRVDAKKNKQPETEMMYIRTRLSKVEQDNIKIFRKLDEIMMAISSMGCREKVKGQYY